MSRRPKGRRRTSAPGRAGGWWSRRRSASGVSTSVPVMSAYLKRYPEVSGDLRLSDRMINLVEDGVDLAVRIGHLPDSSLVARHVGEMRRIVVASKDYLKQRGEPTTPRGDCFARHHPVRRHDGIAGLALRQGRPRGSRGTRATFYHQQRRRRDLACRAGRRPDAGAGLSGGRIDQGRPAQDRAGEIRAAAAADPHRLSDLAAAVGQGAQPSSISSAEISNWHFGRVSVTMRLRALLLRHHAERRVGARDHDAVGLDQALRKADRAAGLDHVGFDREPLPDLRRCRRNRPQARSSPARIRRPSGARSYSPIALSASAAISPPWMRPRPLVCGLGQPQPDDHGRVGPLRIERLPGLGQRALADDGVRSLRGYRGSVDVMR